MEIESEEEACQRGVPFAMNRSCQEVEPEGEEESNLEGHEHGGYSRTQSCCIRELPAWDVHYVCKRLEVWRNSVVDRVKEIDEALGARSNGFNHHVNMVGFCFVLLLGNNYFSF